MDDSQPCSVPPPDANREPEAASPSPPQPRLSRHAEGSLAELLAVALPLMISTGSHSVMIFCDRLFLTRVGTTDLAAAFSAGTIGWSILAIPLGTLGYASTFVSQYFGAGDDAKARAAVWQSFYLSLAAGLLIIATIAAADPFFRLVGHAETLRRKETLYFSIITLAGPIRLVIGCFFCHFSGRGETQIPMIAAIVGNSANIVLSYWLIFGGLGLPAYGLAGAAAGTVIASVLELLFYLGFIGTVRRDTLADWWASRRFDPEMSRRLIGFGLPSGIQMLSDALAITIAIQLVGKIGERELAATTLAFSTNAIVFVPLIGLGMAIGTIVGHRVGAGRPAAAVQSVLLGGRVAALLMGTFAAACVLFPNAVLAPYAWFGQENFSDLEPILVKLLRYLAAFALFDAAAVLFGFAIRGAGDTRFSLYLLTATGWGLLVLPLTLLEANDAMTLDRCWILLTGTIAIQGIGFSLRFFGGKWRSMSVMEDRRDPGGEPA